MVRPMRTGGLIVHRQPTTDYGVQVHVVAWFIIGDAVAAAINRPQVKLNWFWYWEFNDCEYYLGEVLIASEHSLLRAIGFDELEKDLGLVVCAALAQKHAEAG